VTSLLAQTLLFLVT